MPERLQKDSRDTTETDQKQVKLAVTDLEIVHSSHQLVGSYSWLNEDSSTT